MHKINVVLCLSMIRQFDNIQNLKFEDALFGQLNYEKDQIELSAQLIKDLTEDILGQIKLKESRPALDVPVLQCLSDKDILNRHRKALLTRQYFKGQPD